MKNVRLFFASMFSEWGSGLSGPASVPFAILALFASSAVQKTAYAALAVLLGLFSVYRTWLKEHLELEKEKNRNQKPDIDGEIFEAFIGPVTYSPDSEKSSVILLAIKAWNKVQMPDVTIHKYELAIMVGEGDSAQSFTGTQDGWSVHLFAGGSIRNIDISGESLRSIRYLNAYAVPDHVGFYVDGMPPDTKSASSIRLTLIDLSGGSHLIKKDRVEFISQLSGMPKMQ
ncbi:MAG: hypothetical protein WCA10_09065 [Terracidiphilus sp.]